MSNHLAWFLEVAEQQPRESRGWLVVAILVALLVARHAVIAFLSRSERRR
jgi:hypothetical protein